MLLRRSFLSILVSALFGATAISGTFGAQSLALEWDPNAEPDIAGYHLIYGTASGQFTNAVDVQAGTSAVVSGLTEGTTYFFAVTAYNAGGLESLPSNEISFAVPAGAPSPTPTPTAIPVASPSPTPTPVATPPLQPSPTATPQLSPTPTPTTQPTATPIAVATPTPTPTPAASPTPAPSPTPTPTPVAGASSLQVSATQVRLGDTVQVTVINAIRDAHDFVAVFSAASPSAIDWFYLDGSKTAPPAGIESATIPYLLPDQGQYEFRFYGGGKLVASSQKVDVVSDLPTPTPTPTPQPSPDATPQPSPTATPTPQPTATPLPTATATPAPSATPLPSATPSATPLATSLLNVSTRAYVQTGENVLIGGVIISGNSPKKVVLRAIGPSLAGAGLANPLHDPSLRLYDSTGAVIAQNDNWKSNAAAITATGLAPTNDRESTIVTTLAPGAYTAVMSGVGGVKGIALFELYDAEPTSGRIGNISTRGKVEQGNNVMIGGFIIGGTQASQVVIRALGPSLTSSGIVGALPDPALDLYNGNGSRIFGNDNWRSTQEQQVVASGLAPKDDRECAIVATLQPGSYTAIMRGVGSSTGVALVEVYDVTK